MTMMTEAWMDLAACWKVQECRFVMTIRNIRYWTLIWSSLIILCFYHNKIKIEVFYYCDFATYYLLVGTVVIFCKGWQQRSLENSQELYTAFFLSKSRHLSFRFMPVRSRNLNAGSSSIFAQWPLPCLVTALLSILSSSFVHLLSPCRSDKLSSRWHSIHSVL